MNLRLDDIRACIKKSSFIIPWILLSFFNLSCTQLISSPEGTTTSFVEDEKVLVYAPRTARAQKVVFDTDENQMIHERDTPFRKFFDSHSDDFNTGKLDYAKTTILEDVVAKLRNKEYIRSMVHEVVERHKKSAISSAQPIVIKDVYSALSELQNAREEYGGIYSKEFQKEDIDFYELQKKAHDTHYRLGALINNLEEFKGARILKEDKERKIIKAVLIKALIGKLKKIDEKFKELFNLKKASSIEKKIRSAKEIGHVLGTSS